MKQIAYIEDAVSWEEEFSFYIPIKIRFSETDMFGHVNNVSPFIYFEEARIEFFKKTGLFKSVTGNESIPIVADLQCDYHEQIFFGETIQMYVKTNKIGNSSLDVHYMALNNKGNVCLTGRGSMVNVDIKSGKPLPLTVEEKNRLLQV